MAELSLQTTVDGSHTFFSPRYSQPYHSRFGAETEARLVFLQASGIATRLQTGESVSVLELGFGLGLNFLLTADLAQNQHCPLRYTAFDHELISAEQYRQLDYGRLLDNPALADSLQSVFKPCAQRVSRTCHDNFCELILHRYDITLLEPASLSAAPFDAVYLDAFSPETNPECWSLSLFTRLRQCLKPEGVLCSYSVKGSVRRALADAGFRCEKRPGPPGKREILTATPAEQGR